jgi:hypothetical protein
MLLNRWSAQQDRGEAASPSATRGASASISAPGLVIYVVLMSLAAVDWIMSLDPHWYSTIFGFIMVVGQALSALSFAVAVLALFATREPMNHVLKAAHFHDLGKLMLAFVMLWAYFSFSQFLIIWAGNLPEEIPFYLRRFDGGMGLLQPAARVRPLRAAVLPAALARPQAPAAPAGARRVVHHRHPAGRPDLAGRADFNPTRRVHAGHAGERRRAAGLGGVWLFLFAQQLRQAAAGAGERSVFQAHAPARARRGALMSSHDQAGTRTATW